ncbi:perlucin-like protein [Mercenaria mercenaria]|uniref:perlucin-like protein n=1 Tax=Mercenaria mercenaria TaxID=6596 RepID=UPI00234EA526|nr:perlucin-like protein [Mercenaria mercenaria]
MILARMLRLAAICLLFPFCKGEGPQCPCYHYEEQILSKVIRLEHRLELVENKVNMTAEPRPNPVCRQCPDLWLPFQGSCYLFIDDQETFNVARSRCLDLGAFLVHIKSEAEYEFLRTHLRSLKSAWYWIGLTDAHTEGTFKWDGSDEAASFTKWDKGQPDDTGENEDCVHFYSFPYYGWNDRNCESVLKSICEMKK